MTIAIRPGASRTLGHAAQRIHKTFVTNDSYWGRSYWCNEYMGFFWMRMCVIIIMLGLPLTVLSLGPLVLLAYSYFLAIPWAARYDKKNTSTNRLLITANKIMLELKDGWAGHGKAFYRQIWNHNCRHAEHSHMSKCWGSGCNAQTNCSYCEVRIQEMMQLLDSQQSVEAKAMTEVDDDLIELSQQFRENVAIELEGRSPETNIMKEISASVRSK